MKRPEHIKEAQEIGADSFELLNYVDLPRKASVARQVYALRRDQEWQRDHTEEVSSRIDRLIADIEAILEDDGQRVRYSYAAGKGKRKGKKK